MGETTKQSTANFQEYYFIKVLTYFSLSSNEMIEFLEKNDSKIKIDKHR